MLIKHGSPNLTLQPDANVSEDENGLLTGTACYEGDRAYALSVPAVGTLHPFDFRLTCYKREITYMKASKIKATLSYIGVAADPTPFFIEHPGGSGQDPIETHPNFTDFAGTPDDPLNGAYFDTETGEFVGFTDPTNSLCGVKSYIVPSVMVNLSFYTHFVPDLNDVGNLYTWNIPNLVAPPNVKNFLLLGMPYRQIGNVFQVTHQVLGSGPSGWNRKIY
ncbi:hypothetical protein [Prosthecobacter sp.]|uniref:hypothetical protein n=1 Tax=Prosthecobacter sp. TaxID=1965333 RepID=UPI0037853094